MRKLKIPTLVVIALLFGSNSLPAKPLSTTGGMTKLRQQAANMLLATSLLLSPQLLDAQGGADDLQMHGDLKKVTSTSRAYQKGAMLLRVSSEEDGWSAGFHTAFIGNDADNNSLLVARRKPALQDMLLYLAQPNISVNLYGWNGSIAVNVAVEVVDLFKDKTDGTFDMVIFATDVDLAQDYPSMQMAEFPFDDEKDVELLTYRPNNIIPALNILELERLELGVLPLFARSCITVPHDKLTTIGLSTTTCGLADAAVGIGSLIVDEEGKLIGFHSASPDQEVWWVSATTRRLRKTALTLTRGASAVNAANKMTTTWGALKRRER